MSPIEEVIINKKSDINPIWIMRQAGRYLPEFREIRKQNPDFIKLCLNEKLSSEITLQPLKRFNLDAAILQPDNKEKVLNIIKESLKNDNFSDKIEESSLSVPLKEAREKFEKEYLSLQLKKFNGNISKTASFVGMERSALHRKLKGLGIKEFN